MKKLLKYLRPYVKESILGPLFKLIEAALELIVPLVIAYMIDSGIKGGSISTVIKYSLLLLLLGAVGLALSITAQYVCAKAAVGFTTRIRSALFSSISV